MLIVVEVPARSEPPTERALEARRRIGRNIAAARMRADLTQEGLAEQAGISVDSVYRTETGTRAARIDWLVAIADALDVDLAELVRGA